MKALAVGLVGVVGAAGAAGAGAGRSCPHPRMQWRMRLGLKWPCAAASLAPPCQHQGGGVERSGVAGAVGSAGKKKGGGGEDNLVNCMRLVVGYFLLKAAQSNC